MKFHRSDYWKLKKRFPHPLRVWIELDCIFGFWETSAVDSERKNRKMISKNYFSQLANWQFLESRPDTGLKSLKLFWLTQYQHCRFIIRSPQTKNTTTPHSAPSEVQSVSMAVISTKNIARNLLKGLRISNIFRFVFFSTYSLSALMANDRGYFF